MQLFCPQVAAVKSLSAWISLLVFPRLYWLCWELFRCASVGWMAVTIVAVGLFHVLYGQEARPYMMFAVLVLLSNAILLRAIALQKSTARFKSTSKLSKAVWSIYAIALSLGLYSSLLFFWVAFACGIYVIRTENWRFSKTLIAYLLASAAATILLAAGIWVWVYNSKINWDNSRLFPPFPVFDVFT